MQNGLVVARKVGESFWIGNDIQVTVTRIGPNSARVHIHAPQELNIVRDEIKFRRVPIQSSPADVADIGRRRGEFLEADEVADINLESDVIDHA